MPETLLEIENLQIDFHQLKAVKGVSLTIKTGEVLGVVGESGSGKSVTALSIMRLIETPGKISGGKVIFHDGETQIDLLKLPEKELEKILGSRLAMIFQDPMTSLNPVLSIGFQIAETLRVHRRLSKSEAKKSAIDLLRRVGINRADARFSDYPHEFSGGMRQRVMIAMAIACRPQLLIADEPTTALDVTIQAQILELLRGLKQELKMSLIFITHDLGVISQIADRVAVMYAGRIVEIAPTERIFENPQHPYTKALIAAIPKLGHQPPRLQTIEGAPPRLQTADSTYCSFYPRCSSHQAICAADVPVLNEITVGHSAACWLTQEGALADA